MIFYGWREPNEDQEILKQRREREFQLNVEMNASKGEKKEIHEGLMKLGRMSDNDRKMVWRAWNNGIWAFGGCGQAMDDLTNTIPAYSFFL